MITQEYLKECLNYNGRTGVFTWNKRPRNHFSSNRGFNIFNTRDAGSVAGSSHNRGYLVIIISGMSFLAHRLAWLYVFGSLPSEFIDHVNGIKTDNRITNLRNVGADINLKNTKITSSNTSGIMGVTWHKRDELWHVRVNRNKKRIHIGSFNNLLDACCARKSSENKFGYHKNHGRKE